MKKKIIILLTVVVLFALAGIYLSGKEKWGEGMELYGALNVMQNDEQLTSNDGDAIYEVSEKKDIKVSNEFHIYKGKVSLYIYFNDKLICQKDMEEGDYVFDAEPIIGAKGVIHIKYTASDDVDGSYSVHVKTRERRWNKVINKII